MTATLNHLREAARRRRAAARDHRQLMHELAAFTTPAERLELDQIIARTAPEQAAPIEEILRRQDAARRAAGYNTPAFLGH
jgi:hypothetical protein